MALLIHKTLRKTCNVLDIIPGKWYPNIDGLQYLFNNHTYFELHSLAQTPTGSKFAKFYQQPFLSKVYSICSGPTINEISSFFALRDYDIIQLIYSSTEGIFIYRITNSWARVALPQFLSFSNYIYFSNPILFISSARGGIGVFEHSPQKDKPLFHDQKTTVLANFALSKKGFVGRIEEGPVVSIFNKNPFKLRSKKNFSNQFISYIFELDDGSLAICTMASIKIIDIDDDKVEPKEIPLPLMGQQMDPQERTEYITDAVHLSSSTYLLLSSLGKVILMQDTNLTLIYRDSKTSRIFGLTDELVLFTQKGHDHVIRNVIKKQIYFKIHSNVGQNSLYLGAQTHYLAPHTFSYSNDLLLVGKQGLNIMFASTFDCGEPIFGLHSFSTQNQNFIVVSFQNSSRLLEIVENQIKVAEKVLIKENVRTLGICQLLSSQGMNILFQVTPDGLSLYNPKLQTCDYVLNTSTVSSHIVCYTSNSRQILLFSSDKTFNIIQLNQNDKFTVNYYVTAMSFTEPDKTTGLSDYVVYGVYDSQSTPSIEVHQFSIDNAARVRIISERMPSKVASIKIVNTIMDGVEVIKLIAGLEDGTVIVGNIDTVQRVIDKIAMIQFGSYPCYLTQIFTKYETPVFLAMNSRPLIINLIHGLPRFCPLSINSIGHATSIADRNLFLLASGTSISVSAVYDTDNLNSENETSMTMLRIKFPSRIVSVMPIPNDKFVFVALSNSIFLFDSLKTSQAYKDPLIVYENEMIKATCTGSIPGTFQLCIGTIKRREVKLEGENEKGKSEGEITSKIYLYPITITQQGVTTKEPIIGECKMIVTSVCIAMSNLPYQSTVFAACVDTLFCFKPFDNSLQVVARMSGIGTCIRNLVYIPPITRDSKGGLYAGDVSKSVKLLRFSETSKQFKLKAEEGTPRHITALAKYDDRFVCGGDVLGNIFILEYPQIPLNSDSVLDKENFKASRRLSLRFNFFIGDSITGVQYTSNLFNCLWYSTVSGSLGGFISFNSDQGMPNDMINIWRNDYMKQAQLLKRVELEVSQIFLHLTCCDHISFRNKFFPSSNVIDLDIVEVYLMLSDELKLRIANNIQESTKNSSIKFDALKPIDIEFEINKFRKYFIEWHSKR